MNKLEAIRYLLDNGYRGSEWQEAGLLHAIDDLLECNDDLTQEFLDRLITISGDF